MKIKTRELPKPTNLPVLVFLVGISALFQSEAFSFQDVNSSVGTADFPWLAVNQYARSAGMAGAVTAIADGIDAIGSNPAGLSRQSQIRQVSMGWRHQGAGGNTGNLTYLFPASDPSTWALSTQFINHGSIQELNEEGDATGRRFLPLSIAPALTIAQKFSETLRAGLSIKLAVEKLGDFENQQWGLAWAIDAGVQIQPSAKNIGYGFAITNLGRKERSQLIDGESGVLPTTLKAGMYYVPRGWRNTKITSDLDLPWNDYPILNLGGEHQFSREFQLRAGVRVNTPELQRLYEIARDEADDDFLGGTALKATLGSSFTLMDGISFDYAVQWWQELGFVHQVTVKYWVM